jgi:hypothetical protein
MPGRSVCRAHHKQRALSFAYVFTIRHLVQFLQLHRNRGLGFRIDIPLNFIYIDLGLDEPLNGISPFTILLP